MHPLSVMFSAELPDRAGRNQDFRTSRTDDADGGSPRRTPDWEDGNPAVPQPRVDNSPDFPMTGGSHHLT